MVLLLLLAPLANEGINKHLLLSLLTIRAPYHTTTQHKLVTLTPKLINRPSSSNTASVADEFLIFFS
jgi:hypothetical protein